MSQGLARVLIVALGLNDIRRTNPQARSPQWTRQITERKEEGIETVDQSPYSAWSICIGRLPTALFLLTCILIVPGNMLQRCQNQTPVGVAASWGLIISKVSDQPTPKPPSPLPSRWTGFGAKIVASSEIRFPPRKCLHPAKPKPKPSLTASYPMGGRAAVQLQLTGGRGARRASGSWLRLGLDRPTDKPTNQPTNQPTSRPTSSACTLPSSLWIRPAIESCS